MLEIAPSDVYRSQSFADFVDLHFRKLMICLVGEKK